MQNIFKGLIVFCALSTTLGCVRMPSDFEAPDFKGLTREEMEEKAAREVLGEAAETFKNLFGCNKPETDQVVSDEARANTFLVEDKIESQDIEYLSCSGTVETKTHGPVRSMFKMLELPAPENIKGSLSFIEVENARACSKSKVNVVPDAALGTSFTLPDGTKLELDTPFSRVGESGKIYLALTDSNLFSGLRTTLLDGLNALTIKYYGRCLKYKSTESASTECEEAELIGQKEILVDLKVDRPEIEGVKRVDICRSSQRTPSKN